MPSPFPGMNPFLENPDVWSTFHTRMLAEMADRLSAQVRPDYLVHMESCGLFERSPGRHPARATRNPRSEKPRTRGCDRASQPGEQEARAGPRAVPDQAIRDPGLTAHFVEIDLLRGGPRMPDHNRPEGTYGVLVSRAEERPDADFWPIGLRDPLPVIPVPLRRTSHATLELQAILHHVYDHGTYAEEIYDRDPDPPLDAGDVRWARQFIPSVEHTRESP